MKKLIVAAALVLPVSAWATCTVTQPSTTTAKIVCTTANESAPTLATDGMNVANCKRGVAPFVCAPGGTLSGTGTMKVYVWNSYASAWGEVPDLALSVNASGTPVCMGFGSLMVYVRGPRIMLVPSSVGVSAGGVTTYLSCE